MKRIINGVIKRPLTICTIVVALIIFGILSINNMYVNLLPDMNLPVTTVMYTYVGADAKTVLDEATNPISKVIKGSVSGITDITTYSIDNGGAVVCTFDYEIDAKEKIEDIKGAVASLSLPNEIKITKISQYDLNSDAIATISVNSNNIDTLQNDASKLKEELVSIEGVNDVKMIGAYSKKIRISAVEGLDIATLLIVSTLNEEGYNIPFGSIYEGEELVYIKNDSDVKSLDDIKHLPVSFTFKKGVFERINSFKELVKRYEGWTLDEFNANIDEELRNLFTSLNVGQSDVPEETLQRILINYKPVLRYVKQKYLDTNGLPLLDENNNVLTYDAKDFKYIYDSLELKSLLKINLSVDLINLIIETDFLNVRENGDETATLILDIEKIANVEEVKVFENYSNFNGEDSITLEVYANQNANTTSIVESVKEKINLEYDSDILLLDDRASFITDSISNILASIIIGGILAVCVIYIFIRKVRSSIIIAVSLPLSVLSALYFLYLSDITMNMVSLGGLAVGIGMLVDNSIVVLESILKQRDNGKDAFNASIDGTSEVAPSLFASTLTNILVFIPILFIKGITKMIFNDLVYSIGFSMVMSLAVAIFVIPTLYTIFFKKDKEEKEVSEKVIPLKKYELKYQNFLKKALKKKALICIISLLIFLLSTVLVFTEKIEFLPSIDKGIVEVSLSFDNTYDIDECKLVTENVVGKLKDINEVEFINAKIGVKGTGDIYNTSKIRLKIDNSHIKTKDLLSKIRTMCKNASGLNDIRVIEIDGVVAEVTSSFSALSMSIEGEDINTLKEIAAKIETNLLKREGFEKATDDLAGENIQKAIKIDKNKCEEYGIKYLNVVMLLRLGISSYEACMAHIDGESLAVVVGFSDETNSNIDNITSTILGFHDNQVITLSDISTITDEKTISVIKQNNGLYQTVISVEASGLSSGEISKIMKEESSIVLKDYEGYRYVETGITRYLNSAFEGLVIVLVISFVLLYITLAFQFKSLIKPFVVVMAIPFSFTGGFLALFITRTSLNVVSFVGIITLMGVIVNAAIVMIDKIDLLVKDGMNIEDAVTYGPACRLRAIIMSTLTTILALIPLSLGIGKGSELMQPMGISVFGGLLLGTLVTLIIIPSFYCIIKKVKIK